MKILVTGGTGFVGTRLVASLLKGGHEVTLLTRNLTQTERLYSNAVESFIWDPSTGSIPEKAFKNVDAVIHLAGEGIANKRWSKAQKAKIYNSRILGTRQLVSRMSELVPSAPKVFVSASAIGFYGDRNSENLTETSPRGTGFLSDVCADWESEVTKLPTSIREVRLRIGVVLGEGGGALARLLPLFRMGLGGVVGSGSQWMSWIHVKDLVSLLIETASNPNYRGPVNAVAPNPLTNADFTRALAKSLHRPAFLPAPAFALKAAMGELAVLVLSSQKVSPIEANRHGFQYQFPEIDGALGDIVKKKPREHSRPFNGSLNPSEVSSRSSVTRKT